MLDAMEIRATLGKDERFGTPTDRVKNYELLASSLAEVIAARPRDHWISAFSKHDVPFAPVNSIAEVFEDPQVRHLGTFAETSHPSEGKVVGIRNPLRINGMRSDVLAPPVLGAHRTIKFGEG